MIKKSEINEKLDILENILLKENSIKDIVDKENKLKKESLELLSKIKDLLPNAVIAVKKEDALEFQNEKFFKNDKSNIVYVPINYLL